ncbi:MAG: Uncharacterized protein G01um101431_489 [Parcubacteria group bacterium Gr01-1014_31]|nr:MAG: Uncharacterized protein G01um101431_489 [Parcubacteria group bacterium Gr01-1014_31]
MVDYLLDFEQLKKTDAHLAGGKGASLGEMTRAGIPVPPGFVVTAAAFEQFLKGADLVQEIRAALAKVNYRDVHSVERASVIIRDLIHDAAFPKDLSAAVLGRFRQLKSPLVAVRSSATAEDSSVASWAGELESYLNTTAKILLGNVKKCWSSLFTPRAIVYRNEKGMRRSKVSVAVVVQQMIQAEVAGIAFTVHPVTKDYNQMIIEAGFGLGEAIVSGQITPDSYVIDKRDLHLVDINIAAQEKMLVRKSSGGNVWRSVSAEKREVQKLTGRQIVELAKLCTDIERHYSKPQDIEWAFAKKKFFIVQSRPITTL